MSLKNLNKNPCFYGWDIGGAHLKVCQIKNKKDKNVIRAIQIKCKLWKGLKHLSKAIKKVESNWSFNDNDRHFFTMTGEMVDYFPSRSDGVKNILEVLKGIFGHEVECYSQENTLLKLSSKNSWQTIASSNWHATANFVSTHIKEGLLVDIGSTTTDLIPIKNGAPISKKNTSDSRRLKNGELVYLGISRTSVSSIKPILKFKNCSYNVMRESFASTADVFRITNELATENDLYPTCDHKEKTKSASERRLARIIGMDIDDATSKEWEIFANHIKALMIKELHTNIKKVIKRLNLSQQAPLIITGSGAFLAKQLSIENDFKYLMFHELVKKEFELNDLQIKEVNTCAPAVALAIIARKKC